MTRELSPVVGYSRRRRGRAAAVAVAAAAAVAVAVGSVSRGSTRKASGIIKDGTQKARASKLSQPGVHAGRSGHGQFHETHGISASAENIRTCMLEIGLRAPGVEKVWTCLEALSECSPTVWNAAENGRSPEILAGERRAEVAADMHRLRLLNPALFALLWCHQLLKKPEARVFGSKLQAWRDVLYPANPWPYSGCRCGLACYEGWHYGGTGHGE